MSTDMAVRFCAVSGAGSHSASCPTCSRILVKAAEPRIVELLVTSGVRQVSWHTHEEFSEIHEGDPIDHDDLLDFHALLQRDDWIDTLRKMTPG